jgi:hypothetical protein
MQTIDLEIDLSTSFVNNGLFFPLAWACGTRTYDLMYLPLKTSARRPVLSWITPQPSLVINANVHIFESEPTILLRLADCFPPDSVAFLFLPSPLE